MKKEEVLAFGVPEDKIKAFQETYNRDLQKAIVRQNSKAAPDPDAKLRQAIASMLMLIQRTDSLQRVLLYVNRAYYSEPTHKVKF